MPIGTPFGLIHKPGLPCDPDLPTPAQDMSEFSESELDTIDHELCEVCFPDTE